MFLVIMAPVSVPDAAVAAPAVAVVEIDAAAGEITAAAPIVSTGRPNWRGTQFRAGFRSEAYEPITATLKVRGLKAGSWDVYASGSFLGSFTSDSLSGGVPHKISGGLLKPATRKTLEAYAGLMPQAAEQMSQDKPNWPLWVEFMGESRWLMDILREDRGVRSVVLSLVEKDRPTQPNLSVDYLTPEAIAANTADFLKDLERLRQTVVKKKMAPDREAQHLGWLMPLTVKMERKTGDQAAVTVTVENNFDRDVKGTLRVAGARGGQADPSFNLPAGKSQTFVVQMQGEPGPMTINGTAGGHKFRQTVSPMPDGTPNEPRPAPPAYR